MTVRRKPFLLEPGEPLTLPASVYGFLNRFSDFCDITGLDPDHLVSTHICAIPLPLRREDGFGHVETAALWNPLFWLPKRLDPQPDESDEHWATRVMMEVSLTGLYDIDEGTWLNVPALVGVDSDSEEGQARLAAYFAGGDDPDLSRIDLNVGMQVDADHPNWSWALADELAGLYHYAGYGGLANDMLETVEYLRTHPGDDSEALGEATLGLLNMADAVLGQVPATAPKKPVPQAIWDAVKAQSIPTWKRHSVLSIVADNGVFDVLENSFQDIVVWAAPFLTELQAFQEGNVEENPAASQSPQQELQKHPAVAEEAH